MYLALQQWLAAVTVAIGELQQLTGVRREFMVFDSLDHRKDILCGELPIGIPLEAADFFI